MNELLQILHTNNRFNKRRRKWFLSSSNETVKMIRIRSDIRKVLGDYVYY